MKEHWIIQIHDGSEWHPPHRSLGYYDSGIELTELVKILAKIRHRFYHPLRLFNIDTREEISADVL